jgi:membrane protease subunit (stomatin/prohibitin family)
MQSKFMISAAEGSIRSATSKGRDVSAADRALMQARAAFEAKEFGKALSHALKAKKMAEGLPAGAQQDGGAGVTDVGAPMTEGVERWKEENPPAKGASRVSSEKGPTESLACPDCSAAVSTDDAFCRKCGGKLEFQLACPGCGADIENLDAFCRRCGAKLK